MKTLAKLLYVEADEEVTDLVDRLRALQDEDAVSFVVPDRARALQSPMSFRLLKRYADAYGKHVNLISSDPRLQALALESGFSAYPTLAAYESGAEVHRPGESADSAQAEGPVGAAAAVAVAEPVLAGVAESAAPPYARTRTQDVVSAPPRKPVAAPADRGRVVKPPRDRRLFAIGGGVVALLALVFAVLFVPTADVRLTVTGTPLKTDMQLIGQPNPVSGTIDHFPTQAISATESLTAQGTATGQKQIPAIAATGQVVFKNNSHFVVQFPRNTEVGAGGNVRFRTQAATEFLLPGSSSKSIPITAENAGASGDVAANAITIIYPTDQTQDFAVNNAQATGGGADQRVATVIQQSDIDAVSQALTSQLNPKVQDDLNGKAKGQHLIAPDQPKVQTQTDHQLGDETANFNMTMTITASGVTFDNAQVTRLLRDALQRKVPVGSQLLQDPQQTSYDVAQATSDGNVTLNGHASGYTVIVFSQEAMRAHMKGHSPSSARAFLQGLPNVVDVNLRQDPIGLPWLPFFSSHITIHIQEVTGTASP
ncbi:MAG TPA: baseplate J/gp47 family protein [Candidatus Limnocylindrales bacterium]|nr:baseplate J/gp47 family protein [Candidatus Limnocylindrales bacterium]